MSSIYDSLGRPLRDLRISVTDRCNFRCGYCMPAEIFGSGYSFLPKADILSLEEITRVAKIFAQLGVKKVRLTGGEPLLRRDLPCLVQMLAKVPALEDLALTTNGTLLPQLAEPLAKGGLKRVTVSLDALDKDIFRHMSGNATSPEQVTTGIETALDAGLGVKINMVVQRGMNENQILPIAEYGRNLACVDVLGDFRENIVCVDPIGHNLLVLANPAVTSRRGRSPIDDFAYRHDRSQLGSGYYIYLSPPITTV